MSETEEEALDLNGGGDGGGSNAACHKARQISNRARQDRFVIERSMSKSIDGTRWDIRTVIHLVDYSRFNN